MTRRPWSYSRKSRRTSRGRTSPNRRARRWSPFQAGGSPEDPAQPGHGYTVPDFQVTDLDGKPLSVASYKGKVVMIDFWATWCGPCIQELPNLMKAYEKYHGKGFEIIGISLDNEKEKLTTFIKEKNMTWPQYFDGKGWQSDLAAKYGVNSIPATYLLDKEGKIIAKGLRGDALEKALEPILK